MKRHFVPALILLTAGLGVGASGCGEDSKPAPKKPATGGKSGAGGKTGGAGSTSTGGTGTGGKGTAGSTSTGGLDGTGGLTGASGLGGMTASAGTAGSGGDSPVAGMGGMDDTGGTGGTAGTAGTAGAGGTAGVGAVGGMGEVGGMGGTCEIASLNVFTRSDTDQSWDDNDFSDVIVNAGCPVTADVTWPHEAGWQNADPSEANQEAVHFTLDSYYSADLTGKQLNLTIELSEDEQGPGGQVGAYVVSLVSVATWDRVVSTGTAGAAPVTETAYAEAVSAPSDERILYRPGDRTNVTFALPAKSSTVGSYDPTRPIKINVRIRTLFLGSDEPDGAGGAGGEGGGAGEGGEGSGPKPAHDYRTSQFTISRFTVTDVP
jgi:hypothetical protein